MMSENSKKVIKFLQAHANEDVTAEDVANALGLSEKTVNGCFTMSVQRKELGYREGQAVQVKEKKFLRLNEEGLAIDVDADAETEAE